MSLLLLLHSQNKTVIDWSFLGALPSGMTFARASNASYYNSAGVLSTASSGTPRFDYNPSTLAINGLLIEEQRTNLCLYSGLIGGSSWSAMNGASITVNDAVAPDGTTTASLFTATAQYSNVGQNIGYSSGTTYTFSLWAKRVSGNNTLNLWDNSAANANIGSFSPTSQWQRFSFQYVAPNSQVGLVIQDRNSSGFGSILVWGMQVEAGAFATSYIPTTSSAATRAADSLSNTNPFWLNLSAGAFEVETILSQFSTIPITFNNDKSNSGFNTGNGNGYWWNGTSNIQTANSVAIGNVRKEGFSYTAASRAICLNGGAVASDGSAPWPAAPATFYFGSASGSPSVQNINGWLRSFKYWNTALSAAQLQQVTT
jgi:hypothetical protein